MLITYLSTVKLIGEVRAIKILVPVEAFNKKAARLELTAYLNEYLGCEYEIINLYLVDGRDYEVIQRYL